MARFPTKDINIFSGVYLGPCSKCCQYHGSWQPCIDPSQVQVLFAGTTVPFGPVLCDTCKTPLTVQKMPVVSPTTGLTQEMYYYKCPKCQV